ncbi:GAP family protein [Kitasatospora sp. A2-31]|uniref:GAP family protein n=1 Tax=Kitasatospora sp. A2-31 TaxID=2916414 RepID=UPI001EEEEC0F|nr:GAP family protein [Kitasatospora sp. A2-31]MCG6499750.1 GAP family protein [Kitasatospora sp. A2-31]
MGEAIGSMLTSAVGIAISPLPLVAVILVLATPRGRTNGAAFTAGWVLTLSAVVAAAVAAGSGLSADGAKPTWAHWLKLALGVLFVVLAARQWHDRPRAGRVAAPPTWMRAVDRFTPAESAGLAARLVGANPKNLVLAVGGAVSIATSGASGAGKAVAGALMVAIGSLCTLVPLGVHLFGGGRETRMLEEWKAWTATHNSAVTSTVLAVLGTEYIGDAVSALA